MVSSRRLRRRARAAALPALASVLVLGLGATGAAATPTPGQGPSSSQTPYLTAVAPGVQVQSILTTGDTVNNKPGGAPYYMVGIPDGLGAFDNGNGTYTLLMNHELGATTGITRAHGSIGAFVSRWVINSSTNTVVNGSDQIQTVFLYNPVTQTYSAGTTAFGRFCSADLPAVTAFYNAASGNGTQNRIYMNGEEVGSEGRAFAHIATGPAAGTSYELPYLGKFSWENSVASPYASDKTVVIGMDDSTPGQVYVYIGNKAAVGNDIEKAGLTGGTLFGVKVGGGAPNDEVRLTGFGGTSFPFSLFSLGNVSGLTGSTIDTNSGTNISRFLRPEDGSFDPSDPSKFYFVTTDQYDQVKDGVGSTVGRTRLWRLSFSDVNNYSAGGTLEMLLDGTEAGQMLDNITVDGLGHVILLEDVGNNAHNGKIWQYTIATDSLKMLMRHDTARFGDIGLAATAPFTQDEESSGVIPAFSILGPGWFLVDVQAHYAASGPNATELVEGGQLLAFYNPESDPSAPPPDVPEVPVVPILVVSSLALLGGAVAFSRRRQLAVRPS
jgi:hypothetical protein